MNSINKPLVSIVVPLYNNAGFIENTLKSVINQTYQPIEIIVVDDGSSDNSVEIANSVLSKYRGSYLVVEQKNSGVSSARNRGMKIAHGDYCLCLDSDDVLDLSAVETMINFAVNDCLDLVICNFKRISFSSEQYKCYKKGFQEILLHDDALLAHLLRSRNMVAPASLLSRKLYANCAYNEDVTYAEDVKFMWDILLRVSKVGYCSDPLYGYVVHSGSTITSPDVDKIATSIAAYDDSDFKMSFTTLNGEWVPSRFLLGALHVVAKYGSFDDFKWLYQSLDARNRMRILFDFPQFKTRALTKIFSSNIFLFYQVLKHI